jgi:hypothetical protein
MSTNVYSCLKNVFSSDDDVDCDDDEEERNLFARFLSAEKLTTTSSSEYRRENSLILGAKIAINHSSSEYPLSTHENPTPKR